ncbi:uncharacterized protein LOC141712055 [Apium graveolens]|uniref:uncharacterized protein LOC141712055 n=1 Tax=Apium graveolens TaxID=4045 RepID=UPI003D7B4619
MSKIGGVTTCKEPLEILKENKEKENVLVTGSMDVKTLETPGLGILDACRSYALKLVSELDKVKSHELFVDVVELERLRSEAVEMRKAKESLETWLSEMVRAQETASSKISSLMNENVNLSNECNSLSLTVKEQVVGLAGAEGNIAKLKVEY